MKDLNREKLVLPGGRRAPSQTKSAASSNRDSFGARAQEALRPAKLLREKEVIARIGWSRSTMWARIASGSFVKPVRIGPRSVAWPESEVEEFILGLVADRDGGVA